MAQRKNSKDFDEDPVHKFMHAGKTDTWVRIPSDSNIAGKGKGKAAN